MKLSLLLFIDALVHRFMN